MDNNVLETIKESWNTNAGSYDAKHHASKNAGDAREWKNVLETHIGNDHAFKVLDVGTGTGFLVTMISELKYESYGLDMSKGMLDIAKQHAKEKGLDIKFFQGSVENLPFPDNSMDAITNCSLLWTLLAPEAAMKEWLRVLKPGGKLLCFCTIGNRKMNHNHYAQEIEDMLPLKGSSAEKLIQVISDAGFENVEALRLERLENDHGDSAWHLVKGTKGI